MTSVSTNDLDQICHRHQIRIGMPAKPFRPLLFPVVRTDEGTRLTGLNVELVRELSVALSEQWGGVAVMPALYSVPSWESSRLLREGKLDLILPAVAASVPAPILAGVTFSIPHFYNGGITGITTRPVVFYSVRALVRSADKKLYELLENDRALAGLRVAAQTGTSAHFYAVANLKKSRLVVCDSLLAAFVAVESDHPAIDVILGSHLLLEFLIRQVWPGWIPLMRATGEPLLFTREHYAFAMPEQNYQLRWFVNKFLYHLDETGRLIEMRKRWFDEDYACPKRAVTEGLPITTEQVLQHQDSWQCQVTSDQEGLA